MLAAVQPAPGAPRNDSFLAQFRIWHGTVLEWNEDTKRLLRELGCTEQEIERFWTITTIDTPAMMVFGDQFAKTIYMHSTRVARLCEIVERYTKLANGGVGVPFDANFEHATPSWVQFASGSTVCVGLLRPAQRRWACTAPACL